MRISDWSSDVCSSDLQQLRALEFLHHLQRGNHGLDVVAVDRAGVVEAHFLEQRGRHEHALPVLLPAAHELGCRLALVAEQLLAALAQRGGGGAAGGPAQQLGGASSRERVFQECSSSVVAGPFKKNNNP